VSARARTSYLAGLLGQGVKPSLTPELHEREATRQGLRYVYKTIDLGDHELEERALRGLLDHAVRLGFDGLNITHPLKQAMLPLVDRVAPDVGAIGALNTVLVCEGETVGHNTDSAGFDRAFREGLRDVALDLVVLLGAGGAGTAVAHALLHRGVRRLVIVDSDAARAESLAASLDLLRDGPSVLAARQDELPALLKAATGVVNATPVGMAAHPGTPLAEELLHPALWVSDIVYRPLVTPLLQAAVGRGCRTLNGAGMAVHQAADAFELITGRAADRDAMFRDFDDMVANEAVITPPTRATEERN
jgi:shikimate dehydrogenase